MEKLLKLIKDLTWYNKVEKSKEILRLLTTVFLQDAPEDGNTYGRKDGEWEEITGGGEVLVDREVVFLETDTVLDITAKNKFFVLETIPINITIPSNLFEVGNSIIIQGNGLDTLYSTVSVEGDYFGIELNLNLKDDINSFNLDSSAVAILTKVFAESFLGERWTLSYELLTIPSGVSVPNLQAVTTSGATTDRLITSTNANGYRITQPGRAAILKIDSVSVSGTYNQSITKLSASNDVSEPSKVTFSNGFGSKTIEAGDVSVIGGERFLLPKDATQTVSTLATQEYVAKIIPQVASDFANDVAAASGGIAVGGLYHTAGVVKVRLT